MRSSVSSHILSFVLDDRRHNRHELIGFSNQQRGLLRLANATRRAHAKSRPRFATFLQGDAALRDKIAITLSCPGLLEHRREGRAAIDELRHEHATDSATGVDFLTELHNSTRERKRAIADLVPVLVHRGNVVDGSGPPITRARRVPTPRINIWEVFGGRSQRVRTKCNEFLIPNS